MDAVILPPREHACKLVGVIVTEGTKYGTTETVEQLKWTWEGLQFKSPDGKPGIISLWTGLFYGSAKAHLTGLYDAIFGRSLTEAEARRIDAEKLVGVVKGYVMVLSHRKADGTMTSKFGGFRPRDGVDPLDPKDFFLDGESGGPTASAAALLPDDIDTSDLDDPFGDN